MNHHFLQQKSSTLVFVDEAFVVSCLNLFWTATMCDEASFQMETKIIHKLFIVLKCVGLLQQLHWYWYHLLYVCETAGHIHLSLICNKYPTHGAVHGLTITPKVESSKGPIYILKKPETFETMENRIFLNMASK